MLSLVVLLWGVVAQLGGLAHILFIIPLCLCIAVVSKTLRCDDLGRVPKEACVLCVQIILGMYAVGVALWLAFSMLA